MSDKLSSIEMLKKICERLREDGAPDQQPVMVPLRLLEEILEGGSKMKILLERTSEWNYKEIKEYDSLEACVDEILSNHDLFPYVSPEVVVSKCDSKEYADVSYIVEIYDSYRE